MALTAELKAQVTGTLTKSSTVGQSMELSLNESKVLSFVDGSGAGAANKVLQRRYTILESTNEDIDLAGSLTNDFGDAVVFTALKAIFIEHVSGVNPAVVGVGSAPFLGPWGGTTPTFTVPVGGFLATGRADAGGWPVTATTADILRIANAAGGSLVVDVTLIGI